jgi:hypothetical protein
MRFDADIGVAENLDKGAPLRGLDRPGARLFCDEERRCRAHPGKDCRPAIAPMTKTL